MNGVDVAVLLLVAVSGMMGFARGLVREVLGLAAWIGAGIAAVWLFPQVQPVVRGMVANVDLADPVAFGGVFLLVLVISSLVARLLGGAIRQSVLGGLDRTLGLVYGLLRGAAIVVVAYVVAGAVVPMERWPDVVLEARTLPSIYLGAVWAADRVPAPYRPALAVPPPGRSTSAAGLLQANPVGRALAAPTPH